MTANFKRREVAIAPGVTVRAENVYAGAFTRDEVVALEGKPRYFTRAQAGRLATWLNTWIETYDAREAARREEDDA